VKRLRASGGGLLFGAACGCVAAAMDMGLRNLSGLAMGASALLGASVLYAVPLALCGAVWALWRGSAARSPAILMPLTLLIVAGGLINILWLPAQLSLRSLGFDLLMLCLAILLMWLAHRLPAAGRRAQLAATLVLVAGLANASYWARAAAASPPRLEAAAAAGAPDLIVVLLDALRADHTSVYGYARETTPNLETLAAESVVFERAYSASSWTKPAVATLFTGVLPASHGNHRISSRLPTQLPTLPELLAQAGYRSGIFAENSFVSPLFGFGRGADRIVANEADVAAQTTLGHVLLQLATRHRGAARVYDWALLCNRFDPRQRFKSSGGLDVVAASLDWVSDQPAERPLFLYVHLMKPHAPYSCPPPYDGRFGAPDDGEHALRPPRVAGLGVYAQATAPDAASVERLIANYDERILYGDALLGTLLSGLRARGRYDGSLVIVLADHGEEFGEHGLWDHGHSLQEGVLRIPLLLRLPGAANAGTRVASVARLLDVPVTLAAAAQIAPPAHFGGIDLRSRLASAASALDLDVVAQLRHGPGYEMHALVRGQEKLVQTRDSGRETWQLFDLAEDPGESADRLAIAPQLADSLRRDLELALTAAAVHGHADADVELDPHTLERLRALGYVE
jgi:arylsulfatase A-like enzyme